MEMDPRAKNHIRFISIVCVSLILLGGVYYFYTKKSVTYGCIQVVGGVVGIDDTCTQIQDCDRYLTNSDSYYKNECFAHVAIAQKNLQICNRVSVDWMRAECVRRLRDQLSVDADSVAILAPTAGTTISSPVMIQGHAQKGWGVFEAVAGRVEVRDANGVVLGQGRLDSVGDWMQPESNFSALVSYEAPRTATGTLYFESDNASGDPALQKTHVVPVGFSEFGTPTTTVQLFYPNNNAASALEDACDTNSLAPVTRVVARMPWPIQTTIERLITGDLKNEERNDGFSTDFPLVGFRLLDTNLKDGVLTLSFDDPNGATTGGSCRVGILWGQIEKTAKQFPEVRTVEFSPKTLFQP